MLKSGTAPTHGDGASMFAVVLAGGRGTRFWPLSRRACPKQCTALTGEQTMVQATVARLVPLIPPENIIVMTGPDMADLLRAQLAHLPSHNIMVEPSPRNTAPCIALAATEIARRASGRAVMVVVPADHHIADPSALRSVLAAAADAATTTNALITVGIRPRYPESGFGYLATGVPMGTWGGYLFQMVDRFTEKPAVETARKWIADGTHLWNAGMFVFTVDALRDAIREHLPCTAMAMIELSRDPGQLERLWTSMEATSIDYGIMEKSRHILTVSADLGWSDIGAWPALSEVLPVVEGGHGVSRQVISVESRDCVVYAPNKTVTLVGLEGCVVVDTPDAILVMSRERAAEMRTLLARLDEEAPELT